MRTRFLYVISLAGTCAIIGLAVVFASGMGHSADAAPSTKVPSPAVLPTSLPAYLRQTLPTPPAVLPTPPPIPTLNGPPAIVPHLAVTGPKTAAFTEQDVRDFYTKNPVRSDNGTPAGILRIAFLTVGEVKATTPVALPYASGEFVCLVAIKGTFTMNNDLGGIDGQPNTRTMLYEVFDAHTGITLADVWTS
jgi:hypothetical protein